MASPVRTAVWLLTVTFIARVAVDAAITLVAVTIKLKYDPKMVKPPSRVDGDTHALDTAELKFIPFKGDNMEQGFFVSKLRVKDNYAPLTKDMAERNIPATSKRLEGRKLIIHLPFVITRCLKEPTFVKAKAASLKCFCEYTACGGEANNGAKMFAACIASPFLGHYSVTAGQLIKDFGMKKIVDEAVCKGMKTSQDPEELYNVMRGLFNIFSDMVVEDDTKPLDAKEKLKKMQVRRDACIKDSGLGMADAKAFWCQQGANHPSKLVRRLAESAYACMITTSCLTFPKQFHNEFMQETTTYSIMFWNVCGSDDYTETTRLLHISHNDITSQLYVNSFFFGKNAETVQFVQTYYDLIYQSLRLTLMADFLTDEGKEAKKTMLVAVINRSRARCIGWTDGAHGWSQFITDAFDKAVCNVGTCMPTEAMAVVKDFYDCMIADAVMWSDYEMVAVKDKLLFDKYAYGHKKDLCGTVKPGSKSMDEKEFAATYGMAEALPTSKEEFEQRLRRYASACINPQALTINGVYDPAAVYSVFCNAYGVGRWWHLVAFHFYGCVLVEVIGAFHLTRAQLNKQFEMDALLHTIVCPAGTLEAKDVPAQAPVKEALKDIKVDEKRTKTNEIPEPSVDLPWSAMIEKLSKTKRYGNSGPFQKCKVAPPTEFNQYRFDLVFEAGRTFTDNSLQENLSVNEASKSLWNMAFKRCGGNEGMTSKDGLRPAQNKVCIKDIEKQVHNLKRAKVTPEESLKILGKTKEIFECMVADATFVTGLSKAKLMTERKLYEHFTNILCHLQIDKDLLPKSQFEKLMGTVKMGEKIALPAVAALTSELQKFSTECLTLVKPDTPNVEKAAEMSFCYDLPQTPAYQFSAFRHYGCIMFKMMYKYHQTRNDIRATVDKILHDEIFCKGKTTTQILTDNWAVKATKSPLVNPDVVHFNFLEKHGFSLFSKNRPKAPSDIAKI